MNTVGFPISTKENEKRRALIPSDISCLKNKGHIYVEEGYGLVLGYEDSEYVRAGVKVAVRDEVLSKKIICDPKIGDATYLKNLLNQTVFGWVHAVQNREITDQLVGGGLTAYAWEEMFDQGRHIFWRNNEIAGEAAILHAYSLFGLFPYNTRVALIGRGNIARGAMKILTNLGANVTVYNRRTEALLRREIDQYDVIVNAVLWDTRRKDHIVYREDLKRMKRNSMIIDISCDRNGAIETSKPTTFEDPVYLVDHVLHYAVDHTPSIFYKTVSESLSGQVVRFLDDLIEGADHNTVLNHSLIVKEGVILDNKIKEFQNR